MWPAKRFLRCVEGKRVSELRREGSEAGETHVLLEVVGAENEDLVVETLHREPLAC